MFYLFSFWRQGKHNSPTSLTTTREYIPYFRKIIEYYKLGQDFQINYQLLSKYLTAWGLSYWQCCYMNYKWNMEIYVLYGGTESVGGGDWYALSHSWSFTFVFLAETHIAIFKEKYLSNMWSKSEPPEWQSNVIVRDHQVPLVLNYEKIIITYNILKTEITSGKIFLSSNIIFCPQ